MYKYGPFYYGQIHTYFLSIFNLFPVTPFYISCFWTCLISTYVLNVRCDVCVNIFVVSVSDETNIKPICPSVAAEPPASHLHILVSTPVSHRRWEI